MVILRRKKYQVIYPEYFDSKISRKQGRRVSLDKADPNISLKKLEYACNKLKLDFIMEKEAAFPSVWWEKNGRVLIKIDKQEKLPKQKLVQDICEITRKLVVKKKAKKIVKADIKKKYGQIATHSKKKKGYSQSKKKKKKEKRDK